MSLRDQFGGALLFGGLLLLVVMQHPYFYMTAHDLLNGGVLVGRLVFNCSLALGGALLVVVPYDLLWRRNCRHLPVTLALRIVFFLTIALFLAVCNVTLEADDIKLLLLRGGLFVAAAHALLTRPAALLPSRPVLFSALAWLAVLAAGAGGAHHLPTALRWLTDQLLLLLGFAAVSSLPVAAGDDGRAPRAYLLRLLTLFFALTSLHALLQTAGIDFLNWQGSLPLAGEERIAAQATGIFGNPNFLGTLALLGAVGAACTLAAVRRADARALFAGALLLNIAGVIVSYSRAAWVVSIAAALAAAIYLWRQRVRARPRSAAAGAPVPTANVLLLCGGALLLALLLLSWQHDLVAARLRSFTQPGRSLISRALLYDAAVQLWQQHPLFGWGANNFQFVFARVIDRQFFLLYPPSSDFLRHTHNEFLQVLAETGLAGLAAWLALLYFAARSGHGAGRSAVLAAAAVIIATDLFGLNLRYPHFIWLLWLLLALAALRPRGVVASPAAPRGLATVLLLTTLIALLSFMQPFFASSWTRLALLQTGAATDPGAAALRPHPPLAHQRAANLLLNHALEYDPDQPEALLELARLQAQAGDNAAARTSLLALQRVSPVFGNSDYRLFQIERRLGNHAAAAEYLARARALEPNLPE